MRGLLRDATTRGIPRGLRWVALTAFALLALYSAAAKNEKPQAANAAIPAPVPIRIPVEPLGYQPPSNAYLTERHSVSTLDFIDRNHLLLTFRIPGLMKRLPECSADDQDQIIRALVIELPEGKVVRSAEWRMHDRGHYLWSLKNGQFLVRERNSLFLTNASLELRLYLRSPTPIEALNLSPDGKLLVLETELAHPPDEQRRQLVDQAKLDDSSPPREKIQLTMLRAEDGRVIARSQSRNPVNLPVFDDGFIETLSGKKDHWIVRFVPFQGEPSILADVPSACEPTEILLTGDVALVTTCVKGGNDHLGEATSREGKRLWEYRWDGHFIWPTVSASEDGSRVAFSTLRVAHPVSAPDAFAGDEINAQRVEVLDTASGRLAFLGFATPILSAGQNYALSPDGRRFAILRDPAVEVYDLPPVQPAPAAAAKGR